MLSADAPAEMRADADAHRGDCADCEQEYQLAVKVEQGLGILPELFPMQEPSPQIERMFAARLDMAGPIVPLAFDPTQPVELALGCNEFKDMLGDFVSEELPVGTLLEGVEHASACRPCGDELAAMQTLQDGLRMMPDLEPPQSIFTSLMARLDAEEASEAATAPEGETAKVKKLARSKLLPVLG